MPSGWGYGRISSLMRNVNADPSAWLIVWITCLCPSTYGFTRYYHQSLTAQSTLYSLSLNTTLALSATLPSVVLLLWPCRQLVKRQKKSQITKKKRKLMLRFNTQVRKVRKPHDIIPGHYFLTDHNNLTSLRQPISRRYDQHYSWYQLLRLINAFYISYPHFPPSHTLFQFKTVRFRGRGDTDTTLDERNRNAHQSSTGSWQHNSGVNRTGISHWNMQNCKLGQTKEKLKRILSGRLLCFYSLFFAHKKVGFSVSQKLGFYSSLDGWKDGRGGGNFWYDPGFSILPLLLLSNASPRPLIYPIFFLLSCSFLFFTLPVYAPVFLFLC